MCRHIVAGIAPFMFGIFIKNKILIFVLLLVIGGVILSYQFVIKRTEEALYKTHTVAYGDISRVISETGEVKAAEELQLGFRRSGRIEKVFVAVGEKVNTGQELMRLETRDLQIELDEAEASLALVLARRDKLRVGSTPEEIAVTRTAVRNAELSLASVKTAEENASLEFENKKRNLKDVEAKAASDLANLYGDVPDILESVFAAANYALNTQIDDLFSNDNSDTPLLTFDTNATNAKNNANMQRVASRDALNRMNTTTQNLGASDAARDSALASVKSDLTIIRTLLTTLTDALNNALGLGGTTLASYKASVNTALTSINTQISTLTAQEQLIAAEKIDNQNAINTAKSSVDSAESSQESATHNVSLAEGNLQKARDELALKQAGPSKEDLAIAEAGIKEAEARLALIRDEINNSSLRSPAEGVVTKINKKIGETVQVTESALSMISSGRFQIDVDIYEEDIGWVKIGSQVDIRLVAFPGEILKGKVLAIDPAEKIIDKVVYYETHIGFDEEKEGIRPGMTVDLIIEAASKKDVLIIPKDALKKENGNTLVEVLAGSTPQERDVTVGLAGSNNMVEVLSGLKAGDVVILR